MISAIVLTKNEESNIEECLKTIRWADEIVVVDSKSTDRTIAIAENLNAKVYVRDFTNFSDQRNYAIGKCTGDWIFFLDADERVTGDFENEVREIEKISALAPTAYRVDRLEYFMGEFIRHGGFGRGQHNNHIRFWKSGTLTFSGDVHEKVATTGEVGRINSVIEHYSNEGNISGFIRKLNFYTDMEAAVWVADGAIGKFTLIARPVKNFANRYIRLRGYKDGLRGLVYLLLLAFYDFVSCAKKIEKSINLSRSP